MPSPLDARIRGHTLNSVSPDRSYAEGFAWQEHDEEVHLNLRGYPGVTKIPRCREDELQAGKLVVTSVPCFAEPLPAHKNAPGIDATVYTVNQGADMWHLAYVWRHNGSLYLADELPDLGDRRKVLAEVKPRPRAYHEEPLPVQEGWPDAPCAYIAFSDAYEADAAKARELGWPVRELRGGHFHLLVEPAAVADALAELAGL